MLKSKPILLNCQCLVSEGWKEAIIKKASLEENTYSKNSCKALSVDVMITDDNGAKGMVHSVYYESEMIRGIVSDVAAIKGKSADKVMVDDFDDIYCWAYVVQRKSKKGNMYSYIVRFDPIDEEEEAEEKKTSDGGDISSTDSNVTASDTSTINEQPCETKEELCDNAVEANSLKEPETSSEDEDDDEFDFDFWDDDDEED